MCDPNIHDHEDQYTLLSYCYHHKKHQSFDMLLDLTKNRIDINQINNKDNQTIYGILFYHNKLKFF